MNTISLNIEDYLTESERRQIVIDAFRAECAKHSKEDFERIISNSAYHLVGKEVNDVFDNKLEQVLRDKAIKIISELSAYSVFKGPDAWSREATRGWQILQDAVNGNASSIHLKVQELISEMDEDRIVEMVHDQVGNAIINKLRS